MGSESSSVCEESYYFVSSIRLSCSIDYIKSIRWTSGLLVLPEKGRVVGLDSEGNGTEVVAQTCFVLLGEVSRLGV